jgi:hypothetical protein
MPLRDRFPLERYLMWAISESLLGKWRREYLMDPLLFLRPHVRWRNYEAGYDLAELGVAPRTGNRYILQEYFVAIDRFDEFRVRMGQIFRRHRVNVINVSIRHAIRIRIAARAWARGEAFARSRLFGSSHVCATVNGGRVDARCRRLSRAAAPLPPYHACATTDQFHRAYPRARVLRVEAARGSDFRFRNVLWNQPTRPPFRRSHVRTSSASEFRDVYGDPRGAIGSSCSCRTSFICIQTACMR